MAMSACSPENKSYPGLHREKRDHQVKGGNSASLLHSGETPPPVLHPDLGPPAQERYGPARMSLKEGHKNVEKAGTSLLKRKAERIGLVKPEEERVL